MRINCNRTAASAVQSRLQCISLQDANTRAKILNSIFPCQLGSAKGGRVQITKEDGSIILAALHRGTTEANWIESAVNLRMTLR